MQQVIKTNSTKMNYSQLLKQSIKDWKFWVKLFIGLTQITSVIIFLTVSAIFEKDLLAIPEHLSYFTTLSNIFCGVFFINSAFHHHMEGKGEFDNSEVGKIAITYITLTIIIYNLNQIMADDAYIFESWKFVMSFICEHSFVPFLAIIYYLFFYNHENLKDVKEFSKKWIWYMVIGLVSYLTFFSFIGWVAKIFNWTPLYGTMDGSGQASTFVYPFMDWDHGIGFFHFLSSWFECTIILTTIVIVAIGLEYLYTLIALRIKQNYQQKNTIKQNYN